MYKCPKCEVNEVEYSGHLCLDCCGLKKDLKACRKCKIVTDYRNLVVAANCYNFKVGKEEQVLTCKSCFKEITGIEIK